MSSTLEMQKISVNSTVLLKKINNDVSSVEDIRIALQEGTNRYAAVFPSNTILYDIITSLTPLIKKGIPCITYMRHNITGNALFETTLQDIGILKDSALLRLTYNPGAFFHNPPETPVNNTLPNVSNNNNEIPQQLNDDAPDSEEEETKIPKMIIKEEYLQKINSEENSLNNNITEDNNPTLSLNNSICCLREIRNNVNDPEYTTAIKTLFKVIDNIVYINIS